MALYIPRRRISCVTGQLQQGRVKVSITPPQPHHHQVSFVHPTGRIEQGNRAQNYLCGEARRRRRETSITSLLERGGGVGINK